MEKVIVEVGKRRVELAGPLADMVAVIATRGHSWHLGEGEAGLVETVHIRMGDGWIKTRVERDDPPIRDCRTNPAT